MRKRCGGDGAGFELTNGAVTVATCYAASLVIVADVLAVQFHGSSVCSWFRLVRPETMRSSTSAKYVIGLTLFSLAVWISVMAIANERPRHHSPRTTHSCE